MFNAEIDFQNHVSETEERGVEKISKRFAKQIHPRLTKPLLIRSIQQNNVYLKFIEII